MLISIKYNIKWKLLLSIFIITAVQSQAQTDADAIMMTKNNFCTGVMYSYSSWKNYWEGTNKRDNANLGTVSAKTFGVMGNYGISGKLNLLFGIPYVQTKATGGQLHGMKDVQDLSLWIKYLPIEKDLGPGVISVYTIAGVSTSLSAYNPDFLPLSIGLHSTNLSLRAIVDYQVDNWFATVAATYVARSNIKINRDAYYTTELHYTNKVKMPDAAQYNLRVGYRSERLIAEGLLSNWTTLGGYDITKNNMPFPSNRMNMTSAGINVKYNIKKVAGLSLIGGSNFTIAGRNVGQATVYTTGIFYIINFTKNKKPVATDTKKN
ncbi:MAG: hypothetical protein ABJA37_12065 [Ferruginibacter sp.]